MPFVKIELFEGRSEEQKAALAREVTEVVSRIAKAPKEAIHVFINDLPEGIERIDVPWKAQTCAHNGNGRGAFRLCGVQFLAQ